MTDAQQESNSASPVGRERRRRRLWPAVRALLRTRIVAGLATVIPLWVTWKIGKFVFDVTSSATSPIIDQLIGAYFKA